MSLTAIAFLGVYALGLLRSFTVHPLWGLLTYMAVFYLHPPIRWWGAGLPTSMRWSLFAAIVTLISLSQAKQPRQFTDWSSLPIAKVMLLYVAWMWIQLIWANPMHIEDLILMSKFALLFFLFYRIMGNNDALLLIAFAHVLGCFYFGWLTLGASGTGRLEGLGGPSVQDSNTLGMHVSTSLFFIATLVLTQKGWRRMVPLATAPFIANCIVQTESRGAFLGAACGVVVFYYFLPKKQRRMMVPLGVLALCGLLAYAPGAYWERISTIEAATDEQQELDNSAQSRIVLIKAQLQMFLDHPLGLGARTTAYLSRAYLETRWLTVRGAGKDVETEGARASHNTLMAITTDQGIPGILLAIAGGFCMLGMFRSMRTIALHSDDLTRIMLGASACAALTVVYVAGLFTNYLRAEVQFWCMAILAVVIQLEKDTLARAAKGGTG